MFRQVRPFFFFQAEDGIRDIGVTGVQTCALPISALSQAQQIEVAWRAPSLWLFAAGGCLGAFYVTAAVVLTPRIGAGAVRSEERRVGKEWRSRWAPYH